MKKSFLKGIINITVIGLLLSTSSNTILAARIPSSSTNYSAKDNQDASISTRTGGAGLTAGVIYFVPGIGKVLLAATGLVIVAGVTYKAGTAMYNKVHKSIKNGTAKRLSFSKKKTSASKKKTSAKNSGKVSPKIKKIMNKIPSRLLKGNTGYIDLSKFNKKIAKKLIEKKGWALIIDRGNVPHGGSNWKLYTKAINGIRIATISKNGKILRP